MPTYVSFPAVSLCCRLRTPRAEVEEKVDEIVERDKERGERRGSRPRVASNLRV
jgi:hypothetical protein